MKQSNQDYDPPIKIAIALPSQISKGRGPLSTGHRGGNLRVRCTDAEYDVVMEEAQRLGLSMAMFCRASIVRIALALREHREANSLSNMAGEKEGMN